MEAAWRAFAKEQQWLNGEMRPNPVSQEEVNLQSLSIRKLCSASVIGGVLNRRSALFRDKTQIGKTYLSEEEAREAAVIEGLLPDVLSPIVNRSCRPGTMSSRWPNNRSSARVEIAERDFLAVDC
jgi:hypothetical protein